MTENGKDIDLLYLAGPRYGGWVTFTAHLVHCLRNNGYNIRLFQVKKTDEKKDREYGYGVTYRNISRDSLEDLRNPIVTAVDKHYIDVLKEMAAVGMPDARVVIHDPNDLKSGISGLLWSFDIITIRRTVQLLLDEDYSIDSTFIKHPFYQYPIEEVEEQSGVVATSRIDFDKHTDKIILANKILENEGFDPIDIWGKYSRPYVHHKLKDLGFFDYHKGHFDRTFEAISEILAPAKFMVDMSAIVGDGSGTQYTFLEAIHNNVAMILNTAWFEHGIEVLKPGVNCFTVSDEGELADLIMEDPDVEEVLAESKKILKQHDMKCI
jgi:hypothetical protein